MTQDDLHYPNLQYCSVIPAPSSGISHAPPCVSISPKCLDAMSAPIPEAYNFSIEKSVLDKYTQIDSSSNESPLTRESPDQRNDKKSAFTLQQRDVLRRMKSVTNASEDDCASILLNRGFDLNSSIDAYFRGNR
mmetsp:Transcript_13871/g.17502  ORF Transcript_13871/g.17502 Transcript_13871/m.17502 type:complete len:134 (-) Transcript_13871:382-783(-)|eukprot:CAMPEP_0203645200 /NCGR_PEP_ID=MMETSP0088-20131115/10706_1 /ASSEMBLY_ACC=CAM_ASM_001087 /TAXON_ID=426623 /ORGANISM="Chaetoceros affinis, Strain CCMP159" /LENGTH=133 /DNA_ID=CAMNT_0050501943 /DNA_START=38 /DNA_END=439 /DNA_ORIENTATION=+